MTDKNLSIADVEVVEAFVDDSNEATGDWQSSDDPSCSSTVDDNWNDSGCSEWYDSGC